VLLDVTELPERDVELRLKVGNSAQLNFGLGFELFDSPLQLHDAISNAVLS
jgi:hypothetical protein